MNFSVLLFIVISANSDMSHIGKKLSTELCILFLVMKIAFHCTRQKRKCISMKLVVCSTNFFSFRGTFLAFLPVAALLELCLSGKIQKVNIGLK